MPRRSLKLTSHHRCDTSTFVPRLPFKKLEFPTSTDVDFRLVLVDNGEDFSWGPVKLFQSPNFEHTACSLQQLQLIVLSPRVSDVEPTPGPSA